MKLNNFHFENTSASEVYFFTKIDIFYTIAAISTRMYYNVLCRMCVALI